MSHEIMDLPRNEEYTICCDGHIVGTEHLDHEGILRFDYGGYSGSEQLFELRPESIK